MCVCVCVFSSLCNFGVRRKWHTCKNGVSESYVALKLGESAAETFKMFESSCWRKDNWKTTNFKLFSKFRSSVTC